jgi:hypothetical protein
MIRNERIQQDGRQERCRFWSLVPQCAGAMYNQLWRNELRDKYYTGAPARHGARTEISFEFVSCSVTLRELNTQSEKANCNRKKSEQ